MENIQIIIGQNGEAVELPLKEYQRLLDIEVEYIKIKENENRD